MRRRRHVWAACIRPRAERRRRRRPPPGARPAPARMRRGHVWAYYVIGTSGHWDADASASSYSSSLFYCPHAHHLHFRSGSQLRSRTHMTQTAHRTNVTCPECSGECPCRRRPGARPRSLPACLGADRPGGLPYRAPAKSAGACRCQSSDAPPTTLFGERHRRRRVSMCEQGADLPLAASTRQAWHAVRGRVGAAGSGVRSSYSLSPVIHSIAAIGCQRGSRRTPCSRKSIAPCCSS